jgi:predicted helicase
MDKLLHAIFLKSPPNLWDAFEAECQKFYNEPAHSLTDMRTRDNKKVRGDIFEDFCVLYLRNVGGYDNAWRLEDVPPEILEKMGMKRQDFGIDIIVEKAGKYSAVQCKYKKHVSSKINMVTWKALSTFYALCLRTGPWEKYIVMTNCSYVRHQGKKTQKDVSVGLKKLQTMTSDQWVSMCNLVGQTMSVVTTENPKTIEELRKARLKFLGV